MSSPPTAVDRPAVTSEIISQFRVAFRELRCVGSQRLVERGISMSHFHVLAMLERHGGLPMSRLAELIDVSDSNATGLVDRMEERGIVERVRDSRDRRVVHVRITDLGSQVIAELEGVQNEVLGRILGKLSDRQLDRFIAVLADIRSAVTEVGAEEPDLFAHDLASHERAASAPARAVAAP